MCLATNQKIPFIAKKNMIVGKLLESGNSSYYKNFPYKVNKVATSEISILFDTSIPDYAYIVERGFHSWKRLKGNSIFIIPKQSEYYVGVQHDKAIGYVSNQIIYIGRKYNPLTWLKLIKYVLL